MNLNDFGTPTMQGPPSPGTEQQPAILPNVLVQLLLLLQEICDCQGIISAYQATSQLLCICIHQFGNNQQITKQQCHQYK